MTSTELAEELSRQRNKVLSITDALSEEQITKTRVMDADAWTIKDVVGHISYWEQIILDHLRESFKEGKPRPVSAQDPEEKINAREAKKRKGWKWSRVRAEFENTRGALIARVEKLSEMELGFIVPNPWLNHQNEFYSIAQMVEDDAIAHSVEHIAQIQHAIKTEHNN